MKLAMKTFDTVEDIKSATRQALKDGKTVGFVPTMGYLHEGHLSLVREAREHNDVVVASIFVNPTQFGPNEDLERYPRNMERDTALLEAEGVDILFTPTPAIMYPDGFATKVAVEGITDHLCGASRPGHFDGVAQVVAKLFNIVAPTNAYFGMKDFQQLAVIRRMAKDLDMDVNVVGMPIVREDDGLAMSSRNVYLSGEERASALSLSRSFGLAANLVEGGERDPAVIIEAVTNFITDHPHTRIDYVSVADPETMAPLDTIEDTFLLALAVFVGNTRLIDNNLFEVNA